MLRSREILSVLASLSLSAAAAAEVARPADAAPRGGAQICHRAGPNKTVTITVSEAAVAQHVEGHGDRVGACGGGGDL